MKIETKGIVRKKYRQIAIDVAKKTNATMRQPDGIVVSIAFVSKCQIKKLNKQLRGVDKVTDVLSFPATTTRAGELFDLSSPDAQFLADENGSIYFGDIAICMSRIKRQAKEYGVSVSQELKKIVIHSMLHLMGYDHIKDEDYEVMNKQEKLLDKKIKIEG